MVAVGVGLADTVTVEVLEKLPVEAISVYVVVVLGVTVAEEVVCPVLHKYDCALVVPLSVTLVPLQTVLAEEEMLTVGVATS